jgi:uncharacterized protein YlxW (UPF0749 family)
VSNDSIAVLFKIFPALNAIALMGLITLAVRYRLASRKLKIEENSGLRREFIEEMGALRQEVRDLRGENEILRKEIRELHAILDGVRRENQTAQVSGQRVIADALKGLPGAGKVKG